MLRKKKENKLTALYHHFFHLLAAKKLLLFSLLFCVQDYSSIHSRPVFQTFPTNYTVTSDSFRIQLFHESSGAFVQQVNVFNSCDFSSTTSQKDGTVQIELSAGECCDFTFSKSNFATKEITLCATATEHGIQLTSNDEVQEMPDLVDKSLRHYAFDTPAVYWDVDKKLFLSNADEQPFTGSYKGLFYQNGKLKPADFCCSYSPEQEEFVNKNHNLTKKGIQVNSIFKIGLESKLSLQVKGLVLEEKHEFPIEEAKVILVNEKNEKDCQVRLTNLDGIFDFSLRKNECYQLWVEKENYTLVGSPIQICTHKNSVSQSFEFNIFLK